VRVSTFRSSFPRARVFVPLLIAVALLLASVAAATTVAQSTGFSPSFRVGGRILHPKTYTLADLQALPAHDVTVTFQGPGGAQTHQYRGALLYDIATAAGPRFDADQKNDQLRWYAHVTATDNYQAIVSWGEFDPGFEGKQVLLAYEDAGKLLATDGMARLVVPGDLKGGRYVSNVSRISFESALDRGDQFPFPFFGND